MTRSDPSPKLKATSIDSREARLKAALKANIARRKAQARERAAQDDTGDDALGQAQED